MSSATTEADARLPGDPPDRYLEPRIDEEIARRTDDALAIPCRIGATG